ncbi:MAG: hypothetical protein H8E44_01025 [Planctomycetes bacterium]|nr:hypothetical protein [Planctomycetota bacterium]
MSKTPQPVEPDGLPNDRSVPEGSDPSIAKNFSSSFLGSVLIIASVSAFLAVPFTLSQRLDIEYGAKHACELRVTTKRITNPEGQITSEPHEFL